MSFLRSRPARPRVCVSALALLVAALAPAAGEAREDGRRGEGAASAEELPRPSRRGYEDLILIMEPLRPATGPNAVKRILPQEAGPASARDVVARRPAPKVERPEEQAATMKTERAPTAGALASAPAEAVPVSDSAAEAPAPAPAVTAIADAAVDPQTEVLVPGLTEALALAFAHRSAAQPAPDFSLASLDLLRKPDLESTGLMSFLPAPPQTRAPGSAEASQAVVSLGAPSMLGAASTPAPEVLAQGSGAPSPTLPAAAPPPEAAAPLGASSVPPLQAAPGALVRSSVASTTPEIAPLSLRKDEVVAGEEPLRVDSKSEAGAIAAAGSVRAHAEASASGVQGPAAAPPPAKAPATTIGARGPGLLGLIAFRLFQSWKLLLAACATIGAVIAWRRRKAKKPSVAGRVAKPDAPARKAEPAPTAQVKEDASLLAPVKAVATGRLASLFQAVASRQPFAKLASKPEAQAAAAAAAEEGATAAGKTGVARTPRAAMNSTLAGLMAFVQSKLPKRGGEKAMVKAQAEALAQSDAAAATLSRVADIMRKQDVKAAEVGNQQGGPQSSAAAAPAAAAAVDLVEPGDQAAASAALSAREALRRANA